MTAAQLGGLLVGLAAALAALGWLIGRAWRGMQVAVRAAEVITGRPADPRDPEDQGVPGLAARLHAHDQALLQLREQLTTRNGGSTVLDQLTEQLVSIETKADHAHSTAHDAISKVAETADHAAAQRGVIVEAVDALAFALAEHARSSGCRFDTFPHDEPLPDPPERNRP